MGSISARISDDEEETLDEVAALLGEDKSATIRKALSEGLTDIRIRIAVERWTGSAYAGPMPQRVVPIAPPRWPEMASSRAWSRSL